MSAVIKNLTNSEAEAEEWRLRCDMAAVFRVSARLGWNEQMRRRPLGATTSTPWPNFGRGRTPNSAHAASYAKAPRQTTTRKSVSNANSRCR